MSDFWFDQSAAFARAWLSAEQLPAFLEEYERLRPTVVPPRLIVLLDSPAEELLSRVRRRGRQCERHLTAEQLDRIRQAVIQQAGRPDVGPVLQSATTTTKRSSPRCWPPCREWSSIRIDIGNFFAMSNTILKLCCHRRPTAGATPHGARAGRKIGFVPTMGALHEGHLSLVRAAKAECDCTVVSIFVNPSQFGPNEDLAKYPRTLDADLALLAGCGADLVFAPSNDEVYRAGHATWVEVGSVAEPLEGAFRPGHFRGVATVVLKLLNMVQPDAAYFGQKDYQQALVIRRMAADLDVPVAIRVCPTVREPDGLAMSSRNRYLSPAARRRALVLWKSLQLAGKLVEEGQRDAARDRRADARVDRDGGRRPNRLCRAGRSRNAPAGRDHRRPHAGRVGRED